MSALKQIRLMSGLLQVLKSKVAWEQYREAGMARVLSRYTWERTAEGYLSVVDDVLRSPTGDGELPIPGYFADPTPDTDIPLADLAALYFKS